ncbi:hypothetical protein U5640_36420 [Streptomyces sp. SS7]|uniref:hypothetical protein n=1 Tax=Streptomyces sp. SS7 TaxID=3108485 RepID=UPI0030EB523C
MADWPLQLTGEILVDGLWQPVSLRQDPIITITRGMTSEGAQARPSSATVVLDNRSKAYSPRNPRSELYGKLGGYTPFRLRVDDVPTAPAAELTDTFTRTVSNGWGTSDSGDDWVIYDPNAVSPPSSDYSVGSGAGLINLNVLNSSRYIRNEDVSMADFDATFAVTTDQRAQSSNTELAVFASFVGRLDPVAHTYYLYNVGFRTDTGLPGNQGLRIAVNIVKVVNATSVFLQVQKSVPGLTYTPGTPVRVRVQAVGSDLRMRVWADGKSEPAGWHAQAWDDGITTGQVGVRAQNTATSTTMPFNVRFDDLTVAAPVTDTGAVRLAGEIAAWKPQRDRSGANVFTAIEPAGLLRRLGTGQPALRSLMRRHIPPLYPLSYYPFEEGAQGDTRVADATLGAGVGALAVRGMTFGQESTLLGSGPLPVLTETAGMSTPGTAIPAESTGSWAIDMMVRLTTSGYPTDAAEHTILRWLTAGSTAQIYVLSVLLDAGAHRMRLRVYDATDTQLTSASVTSETAVAAGAPGFLDGWRRLEVQAVQNGTATDIQFRWEDTTGAGYFTTVSLAATSTGRISRVVTSFGSGVKGMAIGHLTTWGVVTETAYFHTGLDGLGLGSGSAMDGWRGETARNFLDRLAAQQGVPLEITGRGGERLGPYPPGTFLSILQAAATTEMGLLTDRRDALALKYQTRESLYNKPAALVLDFASGQIFDPFDPEDDDQAVRNQITARRRQGSEATATLDTGKLSVQPPPDGLGVVDTAPEVIVDSDDQLPSQAGWRLHVATVDEMRVTKLTLKMGNPRMRALVNSVLLLDVGSRVQIINTPDEYGPDGFDLLVLGYTETFATGRWDITLNCTPYQPYKVAGRAYYEDFEDTTFVLPYASGGTAAWTRSTAHFNSGTTSLRSGTITNNQTSDAIFTLPPGARELRFWYWTSSEASGVGFEGDRLLVLVDGTQVLRAQGTTGWTQAIVDVTGKSQLIFRYIKDNSASSGEDAVHVDDISVTGLAPPRRGSAGSRLAAGVTATATALSVETTLGPLWTTDPVHFPFDASLGGEVVRVTAITGATSPQAFTVVRAVNGVSKAQTALTAVSLNEPAVRAL